MADAADEAGEWETGECLRWLWRHRFQPYPVRGIWAAAVFDFDAREEIETICKQKVPDHWVSVKSASEFVAVFCYQFTKHKESKGVVT
jgi:hypothetical protein